jgi:hypothetical protein
VTLAESFNADGAFLFGPTHLHGFDKFGVPVGQGVGFGEGFVILDIER